MFNVRSKNWRVARLVFRTRPENYKKYGFTEGDLSENLKDYKIVSYSMHILVGLMPKFALVNIKH